MNLSLIALMPFAGAAFVAAISRLGRLHAAWGSGLVAAIALGIVYPHIATVFSGDVIVQSVSWIPLLGLDFAFRLDGLGLLFVLLILCIGLLIILYARYYLSERDDMGRFYAYLLMFMGSMLGIATSENIIQLLIFWELTSLSSFLLISYWQTRHESRMGARMALAVTGGGGLALLGGFLLLGEIVGSYNLSDILASGDLIRSHELYLPMLILVLLGAFTKSAQFPFHFLAAERDGGTHAGFSVPAFGHHGQSRCFSAGASVSGFVGHFGMVLAGLLYRSCNAGRCRVYRHVQT